jgi:hypothetical protein
MATASRLSSAFTLQTSLSDISAPLQLLANLYRKSEIPIHMVANMHKTDRQESHVSHGDARPRPQTMHTIADTSAGPTSS